MLFNNHCITLSNQNINLCLKDHPQIPYIADIISRKEQHHIVIHHTRSEKLHLTLLESILFYLESTDSKQFQKIELVYFNVDNFMLQQESHETIYHDFNVFCESIAQSEKLLIFAINDEDFLEDTSPNNPLNYFTKLLKTKLSDNQWRIIVLRKKLLHQKCMNNLFSFLQMNEPSKEENLNLIKTFKNAYESYHNVIIPDEIFPYAYSLASHYLPGNSLIDKTLQLIDSSCARTALSEMNDASSEASSAIVTLSQLASVVSSWTNIPISYLHHNKYKLNKFMQYMQQKIFGQDATLNEIGSLLQMTCTGIQHQSGPLCSILLAGPAATGKREFAKHLSEYLFSSQDALFYISQDTQTHLSFSNIYVTSHSGKTKNCNLLDAVKEKPYAILFFDDLDEFSADFLKLFKPILKYGYAFDHTGQEYDFKHAILLFNTTLGADKIIALTKQHLEIESNRVVDLMELVLNENNNQLNNDSYLSQENFNNQIIPYLECLGKDILEHLHITSFVPLNQQAIEKIIKLHMQKLSESLSIEFGISLHYAPEIIGFLTQEIMKHNKNAEPLKKAFEHHIYSNIANEILVRIDDKHRPKRLALLLHESGQLLRCEFIATNEAYVTV